MFVVSEKNQVSLYKYSHCAVINGTIRVFNSK